MRKLFTIVLALVALTPFATAQQPVDWTTPITPFQIADNLYYVGSRDLASYLIVTPQGDILINANLESSPPLLRASVEKLGFHWADIRILLNGQAHFDHVAGAAEVVRETHAKVETMEYDAALMESGGRADFAAVSDGITPYTPVHVDRVLHDGDKITLGNVTLIAHKTAGHTRGCTTFTFQVHVPGEPVGRLRNVVILGGFAPLSGYRLVNTPGHPASYPGIAADFEKTFATLHALHCAIFLGAHGVYFDMLDKLTLLPMHGPSVWIDPDGYRKTIAAAESTFQKMLVKQQTTAAAQ
ncbi:MAG: subclass B3 metallo-beta-lactamase [Acidobacteriaceae bacterium]